uniref:Uncharacterized protein n=1 Tax=Aegilops tauschii subsp. strangulata TaxID=200361 RepID=A0A453LIR8_AEGTS
MHQAHGLVPSEPRTHKHGHYLNITASLGSHHCTHQAHGLLSCQTLLMCKQSTRTTLARYGTDILPADRLVPSSLQAKRKTNLRLVLSLPFCTDRCNPLHQPPPVAPSSPIFPSPKLFDP